MITVFLLILAAVFLVLTWVSVLTLKVGLILAVACILLAIILGTGFVNTVRSRV